VADTAFQSLLRDPFQANKPHLFNTFRRIKSVGRVFLQAASDELLALFRDIFPDWVLKGKWLVCEVMQLATDEYVAHYADRPHVTLWAIVTREIMGHFRRIKLILSSF
jgi:hypothetical protein